MLTICITTDKLISSRNFIQHSHSGHDDTLYTNLTVTLAVSSKQLQCNNYFTYVKVTSPTVVTCIVALTVRWPPSAGGQPEHFNISFPNLKLIQLLR
jgi:hypothetical protein